MKAKIIENLGSIENAEAEYNKSIKLDPEIMIAMYQEVISTTTDSCLRQLLPTIRRLLSYNPDWL